MITRKNKNIVPFILYKIQVLAYRICSSLIPITIIQRLLCGENCNKIF